MTSRLLRRSTQNAGHRPAIAERIDAARERLPRIEAALAHTDGLRADPSTTLDATIARHGEQLDTLELVLRERALLAEIANLTRLVSALIPTSTQCSAALGKNGRCPNAATVEYEQVPWDGRPAYWLKRCDRHPMRGKRSRTIGSSLIHSRGDHLSNTLTEHTDDVRHHEEDHAAHARDVARSSDGRAHARSRGDVRTAHADE